MSHHPETDPKTDITERHADLLAAAKPVAGKLHSALLANGPLALSVSRETPLAIRLCRAVAGQQLSVKAAASIWKRVEAAAQEQDLLASIAASDEDRLRECGLSRSKAKTLQGIAEAFQSEKLNEAELAALCPEGRSEALTALWGVGPWTADMINIFYFGAEDIWPLQDITVTTTFEALVKQSRRNREKLIAKFAPHRSTLALHMWTFKDTNPEI